MPTAERSPPSGTRQAFDLLDDGATGAGAALIGGMFIGGWFFGGQLIERWDRSVYADLHRIAAFCRCPVGGVAVLRFPAFGSGREGSACRGRSMCRRPAAFGLASFLCHSWGIEGVAWGTVIPAVTIELGLLLPYALRLSGDGLVILASGGVAAARAVALSAGYSWLIAQQPWMRPAGRAVGTHAGRKRRAGNRPIRGGTNRSSNCRS